MSVRWDQPSRLLSVDDDPARPTRRLIELAIDLAAVIPFIKHPILDSKISNLTRWYKNWPGEHYKLLTAIVKFLGPEVVWEFGTFTGMGTMALYQGGTAFPGLTKIYTIDSVAQDNNWFYEAPEQNIGIQRILDDFLSPKILQHEDLPKADLIFIDGPKDGNTEYELLRQLGDIKFTHSPIVILDDIREMNMVYLWRELRRPKMDMTSFGHFTGTGLIDWTGEIL